MKNRLGSFRILGVISLLTFPLDVFAVPMAIWLAPWTVDTRTREDNGDARAAFGSSAVRDGQIRDTGFAGELLRGTPAVAKAFSSASSGLFSDGLAEATVDFSRPFRLSGSPRGWHVTLDGLLRGELITDDGGVFSSLFPDALGFANARITGSIPSRLTLALRPEDQRLRQGDQVDNVFLPLLDSEILRDGVYSVFGTLGTRASIEGHGLFSPGGSASANFGSSERSEGRWEVAVSARPLPEPLTLVLLSFGLVGLMVSRLIHTGRPTRFLRNPVGLITKKCVG